VPFVTGETVVETDATWAAAMVDVVQRLEQPLILAFNATASCPVVTVRGR